MKELKKDAYHVTVLGNGFCMNQEEEMGFKEIEKKIYDLKDFPKVQFVRFCLPD